MGLDLRLTKSKFGLDLRFIHSQMNLDLALLNLRRVLDSKNYKYVDGPRFNVFQLSVGPRLNDYEFPDVSQKIIFVRPS
jgi:hypothetical protein